NELSRFPVTSVEDRRLVAEVLDGIVRMLAPIVPHITQRLWEALGNEGLVMDAAWPQVDASALVKDNIELVVQVNGKRRAQINVATDASREAIEAAALAEEKIQRHIDGKPI